MPCGDTLNLDSRSTEGSGYVRRHKLKILVVGVGVIEAVGICEYIYSVHSARLRDESQAQVFIQASTTPEILFS